MTTNGIQVSPVHKRNDINSCVEAFTKKLPELDRIADTIVSIPVGWWVTEDDARKIYTLTNRFWKEWNKHSQKETPHVREATEDDAKEDLFRSS